MTKKTITAFVALILAAGLLEHASAQRGPQWRGGGGWGPNGAYGRMYDPKTVETVTGEVVSVDTIVPMKPMGGGVHLQLKTDKEVLSIHVGPAWYIENQDIKLEPKDKLVVRGSRITFDGKPAIIAAEIRKGDDVLKLRDENGVPYWAGWRRR
jgi:hypothetical protein